MRPERDPIFEEARERADLSSFPGVTVYKAGARWRGPCPICKAGEKKKSDGPFWTNGTSWGCFAGHGDCSDGGDAVRLEQLLRGGSARDAAARIVGGAYEPAEGYQAPTSAQRDARKAAEAAARKAEGEKKLAFAERLWREGRSLTRGDPVWTYLTGRGIADEIVAAAAPMLRYHPSAYWGHVDERPVRAQAMIAQIHAGKGETMLQALGGVHATYLARNGAGKADLDPAKRMWGPQLLEDGRPGGIVLIERGPGPLMVAEGIENTLSAATLYWRRTGVIPRAAAAGSLDRLQGGWRPDRFGRYDPETPMADPEKPPFTLPERSGVLIAIDRDMRPVTVRARGAGGRSVERRLVADARARICGSLAEQGWRRANPHLDANRVRVIAPPPGLDFNDWLTGGASHGA